MEVVDAGDSHPKNPIGTRGECGVRRAIGHPVRGQLLPSNEISVSLEEPRIHSSDVAP